MGWDPDRYLAYADERSRPFTDLLGRVCAVEPASVVDLGCGPGNMTALLAERWPRTPLTGLDSSVEMIARARADHPGIDFAVEDLRDYLAVRPKPVDVLVSNAVLQWLPGHLELMPALVDAVAPGGWLAFGVPDNSAEPSHSIRRNLAAEPPYAAVTVDVPVPKAHDAATYLRALRALGCAVDAWETVYLHVLTGERYGEDPVFTWVSATSARPTLEKLGSLRPAFETELKRRLRIAYPDEGSGVVLPFRRIFVVARTPAARRPAESIREVGAASMRVAG